MFVGVNSLIIPEICSSVSLDLTSLGRGTNMQKKSFSLQDASTGLQSELHTDTWRKKKSSCAKGNKTKSGSHSVALLSVPQVLFVPSASVFVE